MATRVLWGICLALAAMTTGIGFELFLAGAHPLVSYPLVLAGIVVLPVASSVLERVGTIHPSGEA